MKIKNLIHWVRAQLQDTSAPPPGSNMLKSGQQIAQGIDALGRARQLQREVAAKVLAQHAIQANGTLHGLACTCLRIKRVRMAHSGP